MKELYRRRGGQRLGRVTRLLLLIVKHKRLARWLRLRLRSNLKSGRRSRALLLLLQPCRRHIEMIAAVLVVAATTVQFT